MRANRSYPALMVDWLTPAYDFFVRLFLREKRIKRALIAHARIIPGDCLRLGCAASRLLPITWTVGCQLWFVKRALRM